MPANNGCKFAAFIFRQFLTRANRIQNFSILRRISLLYSGYTFRLAIVRNCIEITCAPWLFHCMVVGLRQNLCTAIHNSIPKAPPQVSSSTSAKLAHRPGTKYW